jgi:CheY-like chemotaxis protein
VVEDDAALATIYRSALRFAGFDVYVAANAVAALWYIDGAPPDAVVLDLHLPGLCGDAILGEISARPDLHHIPVIVVTGDPDPRAAAAQAKAILRKPVDVTRLVSIVEQHLPSAA